MKIAPSRLEIRDQLARIDRELATHDRLRQEIRLAPWALVVFSMTAGAAFFAAALAFWATVLPRLAP